MASSPPAGQGGSGGSNDGGGGGGGGGCGGEAIAPPSTRVKVPIPRLRRGSKTREDSFIGNAGSLGDGKNRVSHACEPCRQRKTKCSGERPCCKHCQDFKISCYYADGKRDRAKNEMIALKTRVDIYESLLEQLKAQVDSAGQLAITKALQGLRSQESIIQVRVQPRDGESLVSAGVGSTGSMDHIKEDINSDNSPYPTGYMGKSSEVAWIQRVAQQLAEEAEQESADGAGIPIVDDEYQFQTPAYHLDDLSVSLSGSQIDPYLLPDKKIADRLIETYFNTFHPSFPIVSKKLFMRQYETFFETFFPPGSSRRWLAMLNLKFAVGSLYAKLINVEWKGGDTEHLKYFGRARLLCLDEGSLLEVADLQQVQIMGLTGMYLLASNQTNRAWHVNGLAIRYAQTLGLNLRNDVQNFDEVEKELRVRMWYALYSVEHLLCFMTGRPASIQDKDCSAPLPRPMGEGFDGANGALAFEVPLQHFPDPDGLMTPSTNSGPDSITPKSSTPPLQGIGSNSISTPSHSTPDALYLSVGMSHASSVPPIPSSRASHTPYSQSPGVRPGIHARSSYFLELTKLNKITSAVLSSLYSADTIKRSWSDIQGIISTLELSVIKWRADLPAIWDFGNKRHRDVQFARERMSLAFQFYNARILINRPCLCRLDQRIPNESNRSRDFNRSAAATCILGARETIALLPDEPNPVGLISKSPWWCLLHYLVSAGVILMVEISMRAEHNPQQAEGLLNDSKKVVRWLRAMSKDNIAAERSLTVLTKLLLISAPKIGGDTSDVERDLGESNSATTAAKNRLNNHERPINHLAVHDSVAMLGIETTLDEPLHVPSPRFANTEHLGDVQDIFRGLLDDPFPFGTIPIHSPFDNLMGMPGGAAFHSTAPTSMDAAFRTAPPDYVDTHELVYAADNHHPPHDDDDMHVQMQHHHGQHQQHPLQNHDQHHVQHHCQHEEVGRTNERMQKRLSRGVSNIIMPPPPQFPKWSTTDEYGMSHMGSSYDSGVERARADLMEANESINSNNVESPLSADKSRKRGGEQLAWPTI